MAGIDCSWNDDIIEPLSGEDRMPFGKHKGEKLEDIPAQYFLWLHEQDWFARKYPEVEKYIDNCMDVLEQEATEDRVLIYRNYIEDNPF